MKVGTDGVLLGAWAGLCGETGRVLDVGTGTGLIALMAAQRAPEARIDAVEIDEGAVSQARRNVSDSPWPGRIHVYLSSVQDFAAENREKYDHILSNPPFFSNALKAPDLRRAMARHCHTLPFPDLVGAVVKLLDDDGTFSVILPAEEGEVFRDVARNHGLYGKRRLAVRSVPDGPVKRVLMDFSFRMTEIAEEVLVIESEGRHGYSEKYRELTRDFYLKF